MWHVVSVRCPIHCVGADPGGGAINQAEPGRRSKARAWRGGVGLGPRSRSSQGTVYGAWRGRRSLSGTGIGHVEASRPGMYGGGGRVRVSDPASGRGRAQVPFHEAGAPLSRTQPSSFHLCLCPWLSPHAPSSQGTKSSSRYSSVTCVWEDQNSLRGFTAGG